MAKMIDVGQAKAYVEANYQGDPLIRHMFGTLLDKLPRAEVVHGRWEDFCRGKMCCCSVCKAEFDNTCNEIHGEWKFCPECGAKMDGGADNG